MAKYARKKKDFTLFAHGHYWILAISYVTQALLSQFNICTSINMACATQLF